MKAENLDLEGCIALGGAIVAQAGVDYLKIKRDLENLEDGYERRRLEKELRDIEKFFRSEWYRTLTKVNGKYLKDTLDKYFEKLKSEDKLKEIDYLTCIRS